MALIIIIVSVLLIFVFLVKYKIIWITGEDVLAKRLKKLPTDQYTIFNDVTIKYNNKTCQIDHVILSIYGIFVIENKDYSGNIYGKEEDVEWKQTIAHYENYRGETVDRNYFHNPIRQNYWHVRCLKNLLGENIKMHSIIAFSRNAELYVTSTTPVLYYDELIYYILSQNQKSLTKAQLNTIQLKLQANIITDKSILAQHVRYAQQAHTNQVEKIRNGICPKCGGQLVARKGSYGTFWGCSNYPKCKYTRDFIHL